MLSTAITLVSLVLSVAAVHPRAVHHELSRRAQGEIELSKRYSSTRWTFYDAGLGACGQTNVGSDFIVALNAEQFGSGYPGPNCFKTITMTYNGKSAQAKIMDRCPGCPYGGLDLSRGLFTYFASEDLGVIAGDWYFNDDSSAAAVTTKNAVVKTTSTTKTTVTPPKTTKAATTTSQTKIATPLTTKAATTSTPRAFVTSRTKAASTPRPTTTKTTKAPAATTSSTAKGNTVKTNTTPKVAPTSSIHRNLNQAAASISQASTTPTASSAQHQSSLAAAAQSSAILASSFSSILPSATALAGAVTSANTTAQIHENLQAISVLLTNLGKLIMSAGLGQQ